MKNTLEDIREKLKERAYLNEEHVRFSLVGRILSKLGWDIWNPKEVCTEFCPVIYEDVKKVDIALFIPPNKYASVFIEVKAHQKIDEKNLKDIERQLRDYNRDHSATFTIITDGHQWRFYFALAPGEFADKCYRVIDLLKDDYPQLEEEFNNLLSKENITNGESKKFAEKYLDFSIKERAIRDSLSEAKRRMHLPPFPNLLQSIEQCVKEEGHQVNQEEILAFLEKGTNSELSQNLHTQNGHLNNEANPVRQVEQLRNTSERVNKKSRSDALKVSINGRIFHDKEAIDIFKDVMEYFGLERVYNDVTIKGKYPPIIKKNELSRYRNGTYKPLKNEYYIYSNLSNDRKKQYLDEIAKQLREKIKVEIL
jgi:hypothetical protein